MALGDVELLEAMPKVMGTPNAVVPTWPEYYVEALGRDPRDVRAMLRFASSTGAEAYAAYRAILFLMCDWTTKWSMSGAMKFMNRIASIHPSGNAGLSKRIRMPMIPIPNP